MDLTMTLYRLKSLVALVAGFLLVSMLCYSGCASSEQTRLRDRVERMSDSELLNYYYGINERLKDIEGELQTDDDSDPDNQEHFIQNQTFFVGGQGHGLLQKRKIVWDELQRRNITP
jgi:hypothetical protein